MYFYKKKIIVRGFLEELFDKKYTDDGIHPNELGYNIIAEEINKNLKKDLGQNLIKKAIK